MTRSSIIAIMAWSGIAGILLLPATLARAQQNAGVDTYSCDFWEGKNKKPGGQYVIDRKNQTATGKGIKGKAWVVVSPVSHEIFAKDGTLKLTINRQTGAAAKWTTDDNQWLHGKCTMR